MASSNDTSVIGAKAIKFRGSGSHEFMIWLAEWKKYLVYQGVHHVILEGVDSQGKSHSESSTDHKVFEPDFFMGFWNTDVLKGRADDNTTVKDMIGEEFPWIWGYYSGKQIRAGINLWGSIAVEVPDFQDVLYALRTLGLISATSTELPFPRLYVGLTQAELNDRAAANVVLEAQAAAGDLDAHEKLLQEAVSPCVYELHDIKRRITVADANNVTSKIVEERMLGLQFKNDDELHEDQKLEIAHWGSKCNDFSQYVKVKLGSRWAAYDKELREAQQAAEKRAYKSNEQSKRCLDCMALLGDIKHIPDAEEALKQKDYHRCFLAVDNFYMRSGGQDVGRFRKEAESFRIQPGQDLNSHLDLMRTSIERWLNIEFMEQKSLQLGSQASSSMDVDDPSIQNQKISASLFILNHPEVAFDNSLDLSDNEILAKGKDSVILLSEAKRFTLYSNSVKSSPRFKSIVTTMHAEDESTRTVKALLASLRNFELSTSGSDMLREERQAHPNYKKEIKAYLDVVQMKHEDYPSSDPKDSKKSVNFTSKDTSHDRGSGERKWPRNQSEVREGDVPYCKNHPKFKSHWTWDCSITIQENAEKEKAAKPASSGKKPWQKSSSSTTQQPAAAKGDACTYCFGIAKLQLNCLNHTTANCKMDPKNQSNRKGRKSLNLHIKEAVREALEQPVGKTKKRRRKSKDEDTDTASDYSQDRYGHEPYRGDDEQSKKGKKN